MFSNIGSNTIRNYTALSQNERAQEQFDANANFRELKSTQAGTALEVEQINQVMNNSKYGHKYGHAMELKNQNDRDRAFKEMEQEAKLAKQMANTAKINRTTSDQASLEVGLQGTQRSLEDMARATSGQERPDPDGYSSIGPVNVRYIQPQNMTPTQVAAMDRIKGNREARVQDGVYGEETFADGVKRYVNKASNEVFGQDIWLEDKDNPGEIYSPEHLKMITGQPVRAAKQYQTTTPQGDAETEITSPTDPTAESTTEGPLTEGQPAPTPTETPSTEITTETPSTETPSTLSEDGYDLSPENVKRYKDYAAQNPDFQDGFETKRTIAKNAKEGTASSAMMDVLGRKGPEVDQFVMDLYDKYPEEMNNMQLADFEAFVNEQETAAPATKDAVKAEPKKETTGQTRRELVDYVSALTAQTSNNANIGKGAMKPSDKEEYFLNQTNDPETITRALEAGVTNPMELHDFVEGKGKFKAMTAKEKSDLELRKEKTGVDDKVFDKETGKFSIENLSKLTDRETSTLQRRHGKNTDLKDDQKEYSGHENWFKSRDEIIKLRNSRYTAEKLGESGESFIKKYIGDTAGEKEVAKLHGKLTALLGSTVADQIKILSGTAASDKERANILRFMFGDPLISEDAFIGAMQGRSQFVMNKLPNATERVYNKNGYNLARKFAQLHEKYKDEGDEVYRPKATDSETEFVTPDGIRYPKDMNQEFLRTLKTPERRAIMADLKRRKAQDEN